MLTFIHGEDTYNSQQYLESLTSDFKTKHAISAHVFRSPENSWEEMVSVIAGSGLFSTKKLVVLKNVLAEKEIRESLDSFLKDSSLDVDATLVIYHSGAVDKRLGLVGRLIKKAESREFPLLSPLEVERFITKHAQELGKTIEPSAAQMLAGITGSDLWRASSEVDKLAHSVKSVITSTDVHSAVTGNLNDDIWQFVDAVGLGNKKQSLILLEQQFLSGAEPLYLLSMVIREVRLMLALSNSPSSDAELATTLSLHPYVVKKTRQRAQ
ncbi:MAG: DNA polymerase III subunit delta, partial [Candidatus Komeilibacteria bacterium]|nr:DNA polymerase III subunit delta [Candidatus Komeilibacteria bacterium]